MKTTKTMTARQRRRRDMFLQRLSGIGMILISILIIKLASTGATVEDRDCTAVLLTLPMGLYLLFTKSHVMYW